MAAHTVTCEAGVFIDQPGPCCSAASGVPFLSHQSPSEWHLWERRGARPVRPSRTVPSQPLSLLSDFCNTCVLTSCPVRHWWWLWRPSCEPCLPSAPPLWPFCLSPRPEQSARAPAVQRAGGPALRCPGSVVLGKPHNLFGANDLICKMRIKYPSGCSFL